MHVFVNIYLPICNNQAKMNKLECITTFITVIEEMSFAKAAKKLKLSTPAVSRQITKLEQDLQVQLLSRTTRRLTLTELGQAYYQQCKKTLSDFIDAELMIKGNQKEAKGLLHVMCNRYFAETFILPRLPHFLAQNPNLQLKIDVAEKFPDLGQEGIDIIVGISMEGPPDLKRRQIASTRYILCASPDYLKKHGMPKTAQELRKHHYITHHMRVPDNIIQLDNNEEVIINPILWLNDSRLMRDCAIQGLGMVRLHDYILKQALDNKQLIEILPELHQKIIPVYLYYQPTRFVQPKIRNFIDFFTQDEV